MWLLIIRVLKEQTVNSKAIKKICMFSQILDFSGNYKENVKIHQMYDAYILYLRHQMTWLEQSWNYSYESVHIIRIMLVPELINTAG